ncbi:MAG: KpsF/GutQ family sugar-phosphate isomerase [Syntrophaceae bacterium]
MKKEDTINHAREVLRIEAESILNLIERLGTSFSDAVEMIFKCKGRVIATGIGKSGLIGRKIVATLTSTGTPALFLHPVEGLHGDLGIVTRQDVVLAISNSGETNELNVIICNLKELPVPVISLTGKVNSTLAGLSDLVIDIGVNREACPFGLTPTSSTTATLAMGDALAIALIQRRKFSENDFYKFHPGGTLGQRLMAKVKDVMVQGEKVPKVPSGTAAFKAIGLMDETNLGFVLVTGKGNLLLGILTDGDVRRFVRKGVDFGKKSVDELMTKSPRTIDENASLARTIEIMEQKEITTLVVVSGSNKLKGYIHLHDILGRGGTIRMTMNGTV